MQLKRACAWVHFGDCSIGKKEERNSRLPSVTQCDRRRQHPTTATTISVVTLFQDSSHQATSGTSPRVLCLETPARTPGSITLESGAPFPGGRGPPGPAGYGPPPGGAPPPGHYHPPGPPHHGGPGYPPPGGYGPGPGYGYDGPPAYEPGPPPFRGMGGMPSSFFACVKLRGLPFGVQEAEVGMFLVGT